MSGGALTLAASAQCPAQHGQHIDYKGAIKPLLSTGFIDLKGL